MSPRYPAGRQRNQPTGRTRSTATSSGSEGIPCVALAGADQQGAGVGQHGLDRDVGDDRVVVLTALGGPAGLGAVHAAYRTVRRPAQLDPVPATTERTVGEHVAEPVDA